MTTVISRRFATSVFFFITGVMVILEYEFVTIKQHHNIISILTILIRGAFETSTRVNSYTNKNVI